MPELVLQLTRAGFLALLWIFVLFSLRVVRSDLYSAAGLRALVPGGGRTRGRGRARTARQLLVTQGPLTGTRISLGQYNRRAWHGVNYLVLREINEDASATRLVARFRS